VSISFDRKFFAACLLVILSLIAFAAIETEKNHQPPTESFARQQLNHVQRGDFIRMNDGKMFLVLASTESGISLAPCLTCPTQGWRRDNLSENLNQLHPVVKMNSDEWHGSIAYWIWAER